MCLSALKLRHRSLFSSPKTLYALLCPFARGEPGGAGSEIRVVWVGMPHHWKGSSGNDLNGEFWTENSRGSHTITGRPVRQGGSTGRVHPSAVNPSIVCPAGLGLKLVKPTLKPRRSKDHSVQPYPIWVP